MIAAVIAHCPVLGRDISGLFKAVPHALVHIAARTTNGHDGCIAAHRAIVQMAREHGWPSVFVMEDDCAFTSAFSLEQWERDIRWAGKHGYNVIAGGCVSTRNPVKVRDGLFAVERFKSTHCVAYHESAYAVVDRVKEPIDLQLGLQGGKCVVVHPFVAVQAPSFSGIQNRDVDYRPMYARHEAHLATLAGVSS